MSAGMTCIIYITFTPKINEDIQTELPVRSQTGSFSIPMACTARRVAPSLSRNVVTFSHTVLGEKETVRIRVDNNGALP
ncbi:unnamed protein product, partial [Choristocarpus tenellus]